MGLTPTLNLTPTLTLALTLTLCLQGFVVGFKGSKIFCLHYISMQTIDVPQSASLKRYLDLNNYEAAYKASADPHAP